VRDRCVDHERPEADEREEAAEPHAVGAGTGEQGAGDDGEHHLERDERHGRHRQREAGHRIVRVRQAREVQRADEALAACVGAERQ
jgi:hypothetical protein